MFTIETIGVDVLSFRQVGAVVKEIAEIIHSEEGELYLRQLVRRIADGEIGMRDVTPVLRSLKDYGVNTLASEMIDRMWLNLSHEEGGIAHAIQTILDE